MISRHWKGVCRSADADAYVEHLKRDTFQALTALPGFVRASILRRHLADGVEFQIVTVWESLDAIRAFAGADAEAAVVPDAAQQLMVRFEERATHYEVVS